VAPKRVGYSGGDVKNATHRDHVTHAEAMEFTFDEEDEFYRPAGVIRRARSRP
jgi:peptide methionine sulfoxide reductase MsrA